MEAKERWQRMAAILEAALDVPADQREAFAREACRGDARLHADVVALMAAHSQSSRFLDGSALALVGDDTSAATEPALPSDGAPRFAAGQILGRYRIQHVIGAGGMSEVYAAEEIEHGRRVALKVMKGHLPSAEARDRFLREGRLASAVNHPNSVYVFGSEIIDGHPVIVMELLERGTLKDRVHTEGPLPATAAVDAILQVIAGLEAAHAGAILHRDIKPGNCFVDRDGTVKIGDFGVSVSTAVRVTHSFSSATLHVTPQYAAPEQLRGAAPDVRADIYAVGATLFYLLTGRPPFDDADLLVMLTRLQTEAPPSPRSIAPTVPRGLAAAVLRCLAKDPSARYTTYAALRVGLLPFRSGDPHGVPVAARIAAATVDQGVLFLVATGINLLVLAVRGAPPSSRAWSVSVSLVCMLAYFLATEGFGAASFGKRVFGLRVVDEDGGRPSPRQIGIRTAIFAGVAILPFLPPLEFWARVLGPRDTPPFYERAALLSRVYAVVSVGGRLVPILLFVAARRSNRWAGLHELASGTRVMRVVENEHPAPMTGVASRQPDAVAGSTIPPRRGPFVLGAAIAAPASVALWQGFDPILQRDVWIRDVAPGASISPSERRRLARPGRLRWLGGEAGPAPWEAFEAPPGLPLSAAAARPWAISRRWVADLAAELAACEESGEAIAFTLDHVWITASGRGMFLDFPAPGAEPLPAPEVAGGPERRAQQLLWDVVRFALAGRTGLARVGPRLGPLPPSGTVLLNALRNPDAVGAGELHRLARQALTGATAVPRWSRVVPAVVMLIPAVLMAIVGAATSRVVGQPLIVGVGSQDFALFNALLATDALDRAGVSPADARRKALEVYIARRYEGLAARARQFGGFMAPYKALAEDVAARRVTTEAGELESAIALIGRAQLDVLNDAPRLRLPLAALLPFIVLPPIAAVGLVASVLAVAMRGGLLFSLLGLIVVDEAGGRATRVRTGLRALVAWAPVFALALMRDRIVRALLAGHVDAWVVAAVLLAGLVAAAEMVALAVPSRGVQERVTQTWITPV